MSFGVRALLYIPLTVLAVAAAGLTLGRAAGWDAGVSDLLLPAGACLAAGTLAAVPPLLTRHATQPVVAQMALLSTLIHMLGCAAVAAAVYVAKLRVGNAFAYWLIAFYFSTLIVLVMALAQQIKSAPAAAPADRH